MNLNQEQKFNKELKQSLQNIRRQKPDLIPVYVMKYKQGADQVIRQLKQPFKLYPKNQTLQVVLNKIIQESNDYCKNNNLPQFKKQVYIYTIKLLPQKQEQMNPTEKQIKKNNKTAKGYFIKLQKNTTFEQAYKEYGRQNVLTLVYTDKNNVKMNYGPTREQTFIKWLFRILIIVLILIIVPIIFNSPQSSINPMQSSDFNSNKVQSQDRSLNQVQEDQQNGDYPIWNNEWNNLESGMGQIDQ